MLLPEHTWADQSVQLQTILQQPHLWVRNNRKIFHDTKNACYYLMLLEFEICTGKINSQKVFIDSDLGGSVYFSGKIGLM